MMRKKLVNKDKFQFKEDERLPPLSRNGRMSMQTRLVRKVDNRLPYNANEGDGNVFEAQLDDVRNDTEEIVNAGFNQQKAKNQGLSDPVLQAVVSRLKGSQLSNDNYHSNNNVLLEETPPCNCERSLKLILCGSCGMTFPGRLKVCCSYHPTYIYLLDVEECKGCRDREGLMEYDLPGGMEEGIKNPRIK